MVDYGYVLEADGFSCVIVSLFTDAGTGFSSAFIFSSFIIFSLKLFTDNALKSCFFSSSLTPISPFLIPAIFRRKALCCIYFWSITSARFLVTNRGVPQSITLLNFPSLSSAGTGSLKRLKPMDTAGGGPPSCF